MSSLAQSGPTTDVSATTPAFPRLPLAGAAVLIALLLLVFSDFFWTQWLWASRQQADWGHTLVIPLIAGYFVYLNRHKLLAQPLRPAWLGLVPLILGIAWYAVVAMGPPAIRHFNILAAGVAISVCGLTLLLCGWRAMRWLWFPLLYLVVFGQAISDRIMNVVTHELQDIAAWGSHIILILLGLDTERVGNTLTIIHLGEPKPLNIAEACSGMRMLMAFLALGVAMAYLGLKRYWQRTLLVLLAVPIALFVNMLRVVTLGLLSLIDVEFAAGEFHTFIGLVWLVPAFLIFLGALWVVKRVVIEEEGSEATAHATADAQAGEAPSPPLRFAGPARTAFITACALLIAGGVGFRSATAGLNIYLQKQPVELREHFATIPRVLGPWRAEGPDAQLDAATLESLRTDLYLDRTYVHSETGEVLKLHIAYYSGMIDAVPHVPDRCMTAAGFKRSGLTHTVELPIDQSAWRYDPDVVSHRGGEPYPYVTFPNRITGRPITVHMPLAGPGGFGLRVTPFIHPQIAGGHVYAGFFFIANGRITPYPVAVRLLAFDKTDRFAYYCKVEFTMGGDASLDEEQFHASVADLRHHLLPELMRCLPDWPEVESR
jgi:exosortase